MKNVEYSFYFVNTNVLNLLPTEEEKNAEGTIWRLFRTQNSPMITQLQTSVHLKNAPFP